MFGGQSPYVWILDKQVLHLDLSKAGERELFPLTVADFRGVFTVSPPSRPTDSAVNSTVFSRLQQYLSSHGFNSSATTNSADFEPNFLSAYWVDAILLAAHAIEDLYTSVGLKARDGPLLNDFIHRATFAGATGPVVLGSGGDRTRSTHITYNFDGQFWVPTLQYFNHSGDIVALRPISSVAFGAYFQPGSLPLDRFPVTYSSSGGLAVVLATILVQLILVGSMTIVFRFSKNKLVHASSPLFLGLILAGMVVALFANYAWIGDQTLGSCVAQKWLFYVGFAISFGSLLIKNWRLYMLFNDSTMQIIRITNKQLLGYVGAICSPFVLLLILWSAIDPPIPSASHHSGFWCASRSPAWEYIINILALFGLLCGVFIAVVTRNLPSLYNEAKFISLSIYNLLIVLVFGMALSYFLQPSIQAAASVVIASFVILLAFGGVYCLIFLPKFCTSPSLRHRTNLLFLACFLLQTPFSSHLGRLIKCLRQERRSAPERGHCPRA